MISRRWIACVVVAAILLTGCADDGSQREAAAKRAAGGKPSAASRQQPDAARADHVAPDSAAPDAASQSRPSQSSPSGPRPKGLEAPTAKAAAAKPLRKPPPDPLALAQGAPPAGQIEAARVAAGRLSGFYCLAFSPDGARLACGGWPGRILLWDMDPARGENRGGILRPVVTLDAHEDGVAAIAFTPDGRHLISTGGDRKVLLWDVHSGKMVRQITTLSESPAKRMALSPDGTVLAVGRYLDGLILSARTGQTLWKSDAPGLLAASPASEVLAIVGGEEIRLHDARTGRRTGTMPRPLPLIENVAFSPDGKTLAVTGSAGGQKALALVDVPGGNVRLRWNVKHDGALAYSPGGDILAATVRKLGDQGVQFWNARTGRAIRSLSLSSFPACLAFAPDGWRFAVGTSDGVSLFDVPAIFDFAQQRAVDQLSKKGARAEQVAERLEIDAITSRLEDEDLKLLASIHMPFKLALPDSERITDQGLRHLAGNRYLQELDLSSLEQITDAGLAHLAGLAQIRALNLRGLEKIDDAGAAHLAGLTRLERLDLRYTGIGDAGLRHLRGMAQLQALSLPRDLTDAGLAQVAGLASLTELEVRDGRFTDAGLAHLAGMTQLVSLDLAKTQVGDAGLEHLDRMIHLRRLDLSGTRVTDAGLLRLKDDTCLEELRTEGTSVSDAERERLLQGQGKYDLSLATFEVTKEPVRSLSFSPDGKTLAVTTGKAEVKRIDVAGRKLLEPLAVPMTRVVSAVYVPDGKSLAVGGEGKALLLDVQTGKVQRDLSLSEKPVGTVKLAISKTGQVVAGAYDRRVDVWNLKVDGPQQVLKSYESIDRLALSSDGGRLVVDQPDDRICLWDVAARTRQVAWHDFDGLPAAMVFSPDGKWIASGGGRVVELRDADTLELRHTIAMPERVVALAFLSGAAKLVVGNGDGRATLLRMPAGQHVRTLKGHGTMCDVDSLAVSPDGKMLATAGFKTVKLWDLSVLLPPGQQ